MPPAMTMRWTSAASRAGAPSRVRAAGASCGIGIGPHRGPPPARHRCHRNPGLKKIDRRRNIVGPPGDLRTHLLKTGVASFLPSSLPPPRGERNFGRGEGKASSRRSEVDRKSEEHTSELQSLMRSSYAVSCLKKIKSNQKKKNTNEK